MAELTTTVSNAAEQLADYPGWRTDELPLRIGPLREQWNARGPGLLRRLVLQALQAGWQEHSDEESDEPQRIVIVPPVTGGGGWASGRQSVVLFEGLLANPWRELPETVRLAWLLAQSLLVPPSLPTDAIGLLLDLAVAAGEYVELNRDDEATRKLARTIWL